MSKYTAPFSPGGPAAIDAEICRKLLEVALSKGGEYADLFFEYRASSGMVFEEGITRSASKSVSVGLGVRVLRGDATGYAHVEDLRWESMVRAAQTAARIAASEATVAPVRMEPVAAPQRYELPELPLDQPGTVKRDLLARASAAAHRFDPKVLKSEASNS